MTTKLKDAVGPEDFGILAAEAEKARNYAAFLVAAERERCTRKAADIASACATMYRTEAEASACRHVAHELARALL